MAGTINGVSVGGEYAYDSQGRIKTYTPDLPSGYGSISYTYNNLGQKTSMTVPLGFDDTYNARRIEYKYDRNGRQVGMKVVPVTVASSTTLSTTSTGDTRFFYDDNQNRVKMINQAGDVFYFVYDPTASIPAVVYEQGDEARYLNIPRHSPGQAGT